MRCSSIHDAFKITSVCEPIARRGRHSLPKGTEQCSAVWRCQVGTKLVYQRRIAVDDPSADRDQAAITTSAEVGDQSPGRDHARITAEAQEHGLRLKSIHHISNRRTVVAGQPMRAPIRPVQEITRHAQPDEMTVLLNTRRDREWAVCFHGHEVVPDFPHEPHRVIGDGVLVVVRDNAASP